MLPNRILKLDQTTAKVVRLVETQGVTKGSYIALSYCWGRESDGMPFRTTSKNLQQMLSGISINKLPDAVRVTLDLGITFLWINSLCIVQDSLEDWEIESSNMATVYEQAFLVLGAASAKSAHDGFLRQRRHVMKKRHLLGGSMPLITARSRPRSGLHTTAGVKIVLGHVHNESLAPIDPLTYRGWTFQEQILATRLAFFSKDELQWSCNTELACECTRLVGQSLAGLSLPGYSLAGFSNTQTTFQDSNTMSKDVAFGFWRDAVEEFSHRRLTFVEDTLPAIAGLASQIHKQTHSKYLAGLWIDDVMNELLWQSIATGDHHDPARPSKYQAPSFSWASKSGPVRFVRPWQPQLPLCLIHTPRLRGTIHFEE
jgi:hypothetical protein